MQKTFNSLKALTALASLTIMAACTSTNHQPNEQTQAPAANQQSTAYANQPASPSQLTGYHWKLERATDHTGVTSPQSLHNNNEALVLTFSDHSLNITGLCNAMNAAYETSGAQITIHPLAGTMKMCADQAVMQYEHAVSQLLPQAKSWAISEPATTGAHPMLSLEFNNGDLWFFNGVPTSAQIYGSEGEIMFIEVAPQLVTCHDPNVPNGQCLKTRTVNYDGSGIKQSHGEWQAFYGHIEGYRHQANVRNILRVKRFNHPNPPADASRYVYVLDMVVESETMQ